VAHHGGKVRVEGFRILTSNKGRYQTYFPKIDVLFPLPRPIQETAFTSDLAQSGESLGLHFDGEVKIMHRLSPLQIEEAVGQHLTFLSRLFKYIRVFLSPTPIDNVSKTLISEY
jgi:hypothetical protein